MTKQIAATRSAHLVGLVEVVHHGGHSEGERREARTLPMTSTMIWRRPRCAAIRERTLHVAKRRCIPSGGPRTSSFARSANARTTPMNEATATPCFITWK